MRLARYQIRPKIIRLRECCCYTESAGTGERLEFLFFPDFCSRTEYVCDDSACDS